MPPKSATTQSPVEFGVVELHIGRKKWTAGASGKLIHMKEVFGGELHPTSIPQKEVTLRGKALFGRGRFAFEVEEIDNTPKNIEALLGRRDAHFAGTAIGHILARQFAPLSSFQIKFEDISSVEHVGRMITMRLSAAVLCYSKPPGKGRTANLQVSKDITGGARTLQFKVCGPAQVDTSSANQKQVAFSVAKAIVMEQSPRLKGLFHGEPVSEAPPPVTPQKRKCQSEMPASVAKRIRKEAKGSCMCSPGDKAAIDADNAKMALNKYVKSLAATVDADWHDSYEETAEELEEYFQDCGKRVQNVLRVGVTCGQEFGECHETLKQVADTWSNIQAIPFRGDPGDDLSNGEGVTLFENVTGDDDEQDSCNGEGAVHCPVELLEIVWPALLACAAGDEKMSDAVLMQMIKDAVDHGVAEPCVAAGAISNIKMMLTPAFQQHLMKGHRRVLALISRQDEWKAMPSTKKVHKMRRCIDRRFDGPKHLRTRDYGSDSEDDMRSGGCSVM